MEVLFIYVLVAIVVTGHILLVREKDADGNDIARLVEWAENGGHITATPATPTPATVVSASASAADADVPTNLLPGEEEDKWEELAKDWEFPEVGKNSHDDWKKLPAIMVRDCKYNRTLRGCGRRGKGKQKGGKHIDKKRFRRADTKAHLSLA